MPKTKKFKPGCKDCKTTIHKPNAYHKATWKSFSCSKCSHNQECSAGKALLGATRSLNKILYGGVKPK